MSDDTLAPSQSAAEPESWQDKWRQKDAWTIREFAQLCCGWNPDVYAFADRELYDKALDSINRAVRVKAIPAIDLIWPPTGAERLIDSVPMFRPGDVASWAAKHHPAGFPYQAMASETVSSIGKSLGQRERTTLLTIIAALAQERDIDLSTPSKAASQIEKLTEALGVRVSARSIEEHIKRIPEALERRSKSS